MEIDNLKVKTYIEDEYKLAYAKARKELGHNLVIIEKKEVKEGGVFGLFGKKRVRVTFGVELVKKDKKKTQITKNEEENSELIKALRDVAVKHMNELSEEPKEEKFKPLAQELFNIKNTEDVINTGAYTPFKKDNKKSFEDIQKELNLVPKMSTEEIKIEGSKDHKEESPIDKLKRELQKELKNNNTNKKNTKTTRKAPRKTSMNNDFVDFLRDNEFDKELALEIDEYFNKNNLDKVDYKEGLRNFIKQCIRVKHEETTKKFVMLIGPTGVGKTTTCAKIVANNWRNEKKVGFITADTYRLEAVSQLKAYANIMRVPIEIVSKPEDLGKTIEKFREKDLVLMDTAGRSPKNKEQMDELRSYVSSKGDDMETILVLSATSKISVLHETIEKFEQIGFDSIIITKIDETSSLSSLLSIFKRYSYPFYYITTGQSVPDDIEICTEAMLAEIFMKGIK
jgi:flagellar biosynthesis protein FlhF